jgi:hypothetical protein
VLIVILAKAFGYAKTGLHAVVAHIPGVSDLSVGVTTALSIAMIALVCLLAGLSTSLRFFDTAPLSTSLKNQMIGHLTDLPWSEALHDPFNDIREYQCRDRWSKRPNALIEARDI